MAKSKSITRKDLDDLAVYAAEGAGATLKICYDFMDTYLSAVERLDRELSGNISELARRKEILRDQYNHLTDAVVPMAKRMSVVSRFVRANLDKIEGIFDKEDKDVRTKGT